MYKILHFSSVRKPPGILQLHLQSLNDLNTSGYEVIYSFIDDNDDQLSSDLLKKFCNEKNGRVLLDFDISTLPNYSGDERWQEDLYKRITLIKNKAINYFLENNYDYLFLTDSDLIIHPQTLNNLVNAGKDFCASIFWTHFDKSPTYTPNCWNSVPKGFTLNNLLTWINPGTFEVDFTGACTLLSRKILSKDVSFEKIKNVSYLGEDKHFCIRASVLGFQPYINTQNPSFHLYNKDYIKEGLEYIESGYKSYTDEWLNEKWKKSLINWLEGNRKKSLIKKIICWLKK
ncbi:glycosyltransferase family protein [Aequorivita echinoideorum]|uniref:Glycosyl transferase family 2 n=1 Tax=Aequorivita echinoideorum TaxID=1549647 RepID=A0ABS5S5G1_9FLAO|nr:hypothetical protein [Aequorivita echinoideorum]MBT0608450.1 hypothetical protein [Aequorivita echinoideorum]